METASLVLAIPPLIQLIRQLIHYLQDVGDSVLQPIFGTYRYIGSRDKARNHHSPSPYQQRFRGRRYTPQ